MSILQNPIQIPNPANCLAGGGEMGALMRSMDWSGSPIGPVERWPSALQTMVRVLLANRLQMLIWWGPQFCQFYNDAFRTALGAKHPRAMGQPARECWAEIWHTIGPLIQKSFDDGEAICRDDLCLEINRRGFAEETHWAIAYSPIPDDTIPNGVGGVLGIMTEITEKVLADRPLHPPPDLDARAFQAKTGGEAVAVEGRLRDSEERFRLMVESVRNHAIFMLDAGGRVITWNHSAECIQGYSSQDILGRHFSLFYEQNDIDSGKPEKALEAAATAGWFEDEGWRVRKDGSRFWGNVVISALKNKAGRLQGFVKVTRDMTERKRAEEALRASEERFRRYFDLGLIGMAITSPAKAYLEANDELCRILGYGRSELQQKSWAEMTHPDDLAADVAQFNRVLAGEIDAYTLEKRWIRKDGRVIDSMMAAKCTRRPDGSVDYFVGLVLDTTERKRAETALREAHNQRQMILNSLNDRFFALDSQWRYTYFNRQAEAQLVTLGKDPASLMGRVLWEEFPNPPTADMLRRAMRERIPLTHEHYYAPLGEWVENRVYPTSDGGLAIFQQYVTERKRAERELLALKDELAAELAAMTRLHEFSTALLANPDLRPTLQEVLDIIMSLQNADFGNVALYNPATHVLEIVAQRGFRQDFLDTFSSLHEDSTPCGRALQQRERVIIEDVLTDPDFLPHREIAASAGFRAVQSTPLLSRAGKPLGVISTHFRWPHRPSERVLRFTDLYTRQAAEMVERRQTEDALRATQAELTHVTRVVAMGELTSSIAHEINQPLTVVVANANACSRMLAAGAPDLQEIQAAVQDIAAAGTRAAEVISRIRSLLRKAAPEKSRLDANEIILEVLGIARGELQKHKISTWTELHPDLPPVLGDLVLLEQVVLNLVLNAIEAMAGVDQPRVLCVRSSLAQSGGVLIAVEDSGAGINAPNIEQIFDTFFTTKQQGMGLGLPISRSIIAAHGGRLWAEPVRAGGTRFQFTLARTA